ncbi:MAG: FAD-dependent oxidoreductase, partial [Gammaproteobacteria bacterium]
MAAYCDEHQLPISRVGKIIVTTKPDEAPVLETLQQRAIQNGAKVRLISRTELKELEPEAYSATDYALFSPETSVVDPKAILAHLYQSLIDQHVIFYFNQKNTTIDTNKKQLTLTTDLVSYGHLFNTAGLYADDIAKRCGLQEQYTMIPFKGLYYEMAPQTNIKINHLIYPVPDMHVPFLGVHFTKGIDGKIYLGPTAIPVLGREHYTGLTGINLKEAMSTFTSLAPLYINNKQGFRTYAHQEIPRFLKSRFVASARALVPSITSQDLVSSKKVGIRAQLFDLDKKELAMDFIIRSTKNETHVLNAVSPAFSSAFSFCRQVLQHAQ